MVEISWSKPATEQLERIMIHVGQFDRVAALRIGERLHTAEASLSAFPNRGRPGIERQTREMTTVPPYVMTYEVTGDLVIILDVRHGRQAPRRPRS